LPPGSQDYRQRAARFREVGALTLLSRATGLNALLKNSSGNLFTPSRE
jgi:hypothetical protein